MAHVTIPDQDSYVIYTNQTGVGPYDVPFAIFEKADLVVKVAGVDIGQNGFSYTATSSTTGGYQTGEIELDVAAAGEDVEIYRRINPKRTSDMGPGPQARDALNSALDRVHALQQDNQRDIDRALKLPFGETPSDTLLDALETVAGIADEVEQVAAVDAEVEIVAGIASDVTATAGVVDEIIAVAAALINSALVGALAFATETGLAARSLIDRALGNERPVTDWVTDARGGATRRAAIYAGTSPGDDQAAVAAAVAWAYASPRTRTLRVDGDFICTTDVPNIHDVRMLGPGSIRIAGGTKWFATPTKHNTGFISPSQYEDVYVNAAAGNDANSGLASAYPLATMARAFQILAKRGSPLQGMHRILGGKWVSTEDFSTFGVTNTRESFPFYILGTSAGGTWDNSNPPPPPTPITAITSANPPVVTSEAHGCSNGEEVVLYLCSNASGRHDADGRIFTVANVTANTFELSGIDGSGWAAYTGTGVGVYSGLGQMQRLTGAMATTIFYGAGQAKWGGMVNANLYGQAINLLFLGWGARSRGSADEGGMKARFHSNWEWINCYAQSCTKAFQTRDKSIGAWTSGRAYDVNVGAWNIDSSFTVGDPDSTLGMTTTPLIQNFNTGVDWWENAVGHIDGVMMVNGSDCLIKVHRNAHGSAANNTFVNSGAPIPGVKVYGGAHFTDAGNRWIGGFLPRIQRLSGATLEADALTSYDYRIMGVEQFSFTSSGTSQTVFSESLGDAKLYDKKQRLRVTLKGQIINATPGTISAQLTVGGVTTTHNFSGSGDRYYSLVWEGVPTGLGTARLSKDLRDSVGGDSFIYTTPAWATNRKWATGCRAGTTVAGTLASSFAAGQTIDGVVLRLGDRILIKNQASAIENGVYIVTAGTPTRATDLDAGSEIGAASVAVRLGTTNKLTQWVCDQTTSVVVGTDSLTFTQITTELTNDLSVAVNKASGDSFYVFNATWELGGA